MNQLRLLLSQRQLLHNQRHESADFAPARKPCGKFVAIRNLQICFYENFHLLD